MPRPFKSIEEQIDILNRRGISTDENTHSILLRENYYCVVNGYKDYFLNDSNKADSYKNGTSFMDIYTLFLLDRELRHLFLKRIMSVETLFRTVIAYHACEHHRSDIQFYLSKEVYHGKSAEIQKLIKNLQHCHDEDRKNLVHYRDTHGEIPFWVIVNNTTFGTLSYFYKLLGSRSIKQRVANTITTLCVNKKDNAITVEKLSHDLRVLVDFRNVCAHNERFYCHTSERINVLPNKPASVATLMGTLKKYLSDEEWIEHINNLAELLSVFLESRNLSHSVASKVLSTITGAKTGFEDKLNKE